MANKVTPAIKSPGSDKFPTGGPHNPNVGTHGKGGALARVKGAGMGDSGMRMPVQSPKANLANTRIGQANPDTGATATKKPNRKGGAAFYGEM